ncbi:hypothetical protein IscW_ISCW013265, partial [Ixodes scapularis]
MTARGTALANQKRFCALREDFKSGYKERGANRKAPKRACNFEDLLQGTPRARYGPCLQVW